MEKTIEIQKVRVYNPAHEEYLRTLPAMSFADGEISRGILSFRVNILRGKGWILAHDRKKVRHVFQIENDNAVTSSVWELESADTLDGLLSIAKIKSLDLSSIDLEEMRI